MSATSRRKSATPYEVLTGSAAPSPFRGAGTGGLPPSANSSVFVQPSNSSSYNNTPVRRYGSAAAGFAPEHAANGIGSPFRRNVPFGSPGPRATPLSAAAASAGRQPAGSPAPNDTPGAARRKSKRFIRRKPLKERLAALPVDLYHSLSLQLSFYLDDITTLPPQAGLFIGGFLHLLSIMAHVISPDSDVSLGYMLVAFSRRGGLFGGGSADGGKGGRSLFKSDRRSVLAPTTSSGASALGTDGLSPAEQIRRLASARRESWLRGTSITLSLLAFVLATYNAYVLFMSSRRQYQMFMKSTDEPVRSENAKLVPVSTSEEEGLTWQEKIFELLLVQMRKVPFVKWFVPRDQTAWRRSRAAEPAKMHVLDVWQAPELHLAIFSVYTPLHALWYHFAGLLGVKGPITWIATWLIMAGLGAQTYWLVHEFQTLIKDRNIISGEVYHEYDEKVVKPRAMTEMRDASTMTNEAEIISIWERANASRSTAGTPSARKSEVATPRGSSRKATGRKTASAATADAIAPP